MIFQATRIPGVFEIEMELHKDGRGSFARSWCQKEFEIHGLDSRVVQCNVSHNAMKGTLRGMHYQAVPFAEAKLVRCTAGEVYDVVLDLRDQSPTFCQWFGTTLSAENRRSVYIPEGCAHGFLTLQNDSEVFYQMSEFYHPEAGRGVRWNDPAFQIEWPEMPLVMSERDRTYADFT